MDDYENFEELTSSFWKPVEVNEQIKGTICGETQTQYGKAVLIKTNDGIFMLGNKMLVEKLAPMQGALIRITYLGEKKGKTGRTYKDFRIEHAKGEVRSPQ